MTRHKLISLKYVNDRGVDSYLFNISEEQDEQLFSGYLNKFMFRKLNTIFFEFLRYGNNK